MIRIMEPLKWHLYKNKQNNNNNNNKKDFAHAQETYVLVRRHENIQVFSHFPGCTSSLGQSHLRKVTYKL